MSKIKLLAFIIIFPTTPLQGPRTRNKKRTMTSIWYFCTIFANPGAIIFTNLNPSSGGSGSMLKTARAIFTKENNLQNPNIKVSLFSKRSSKSRSDQYVWLDWGLIFFGFSALDLKAYKKQMHEHIHAIKLIPKGSQLFELVQ